MREEGKEMNEEERANKYGRMNDQKYFAFKDSPAPYFTEKALRMVHHGFSS
jgi:hypothetical protein